MFTNTLVTTQGSLVATRERVPFSIAKSLMRCAQELMTKHTMPRSIAFLTSLALVKNPNATVEVVRPTPRSIDPIVLVDGKAIGGWF